MSDIGFVGVLIVSLRVNLAGYWSHFDQSNALHQDLHRI